MTTLLLIRHGQSRANLENVFAGHYNAPLTDLGKMQAQMTADFIKERYRVDAVYASDLDRAFVTGQTVAETVGLTAIADKGLREIYGGEWEGADYLRLPERYPEVFGVWLGDIGRAQCPAGESTAQVQQRLMETLRRIVSDNEGGTVAVATHACAIRCVMSYCIYKGVEQMGQVPWVSNASVTVIEAENGEFSIKAAGLDEHLKNFTTTLGGGV